MATQVNLFNQKQQIRYLSRTGISVDIQKIGKFTDCVAVRVPSSIKEIRPGIWMKKESKEFSKGNFTNVYDLFWSSSHSGVIPEIHSSNTPYPLVDRLKKDINTIGAINGAFYFLAEVAHRKPIDLPYDLCVREGKVYGLPSSDEPIAYIQGGKLQTNEPRALGVILVGSKRLKWVGRFSRAVARSPYTAVLYNSRCSKVLRLRDPKTNIQVGILDDKRVATPKKAGVLDVVVGLDKNEDLVVTNLNYGGGTHFFEGLFILQLRKPKGRFTIGEKVAPLTLDKLALTTITAGITIRKLKDDPLLRRKMKAGTHDARSVIAEDNEGQIHFIVFDGSKYIPGFPGVSIKEIEPLFRKDKFKWAYLLDGGGSSRIVAREKVKKIHYLANEFAFRKLKDGQILWDWQNARRLASSISIRV